MHGTEKDEKRASIRRMKALTTYEVIKRQYDLLAKKVGISKPTDLSLKDCEKERNTASSAYRKIKRNAQTSRAIFIQDLDF